MADSTASESDSFYSYYYRFLQWRRTSTKDLENVDTKILNSLPCVQERKYVTVNGGNSLWSIMCGSRRDTTPIVVVHGMGAGVGFWALNLEDLSRDRKLYAFDLLGFGRSSRPTFSQDAQEVEDTFVDSIESFRQQMGLEKFILLGHSLGGFLGASYALRYPQHVKHLILVDPWGMPRRPEVNPKPLPLAFRMLIKVVNYGYPMSVVRAAGPLGPSLVRYYRPQLAEIFGQKLGDNSLLHDYIYHCNAQDPSGEVGFKNMSDGFGWAKRPMMERLPAIDPSIPVTFVYGAKSWIDRRTGLGFQQTHKGSVDVQIIEGAGHHVHADRWAVFNQLIEAVCQAVDSNQPTANIDHPLLARIHGSPTSPCLQVPDPEETDFQHPMGHGDENVTQTPKPVLSSSSNQDCSEGKKSPQVS